MEHRTILFVANDATPDAQIKDAAEAAFVQKNHLICLLISGAPAFPMYISPYGGGIPDNWTEIVGVAKDQLDGRAKEIKALLSASGASGEVQSTMCAAPEIKHIVSRLACVSDEAILAENLRETPDTMREAASGILFHSPIGFRINGSASLVPEKVLVAWDGSSAASAALHVALPYLHEAKEVVIACFDPVMTGDQHGQDPGVDVAAWLSHRGCKVTVSQFPTGGREIGDCIQDRARETGADLVVMGAYGHARMIQTVLGGTTRTLIEQQETPVLFAH